MGDLALSWKELGRPSDAMDLRNAALNPSQVLATREILAGMGEET